MKDDTPREELHLGDRVCYFPGDPRSTSQPSSDPASPQGIVTGLVNVGNTTLALVKWDRADMPAQVDVSELKVLRRAG